MPTFSGDISIDYMKPRADDGTIGTSTFDMVVVTVDQLIGGTTTLMNAQLHLQIFEDGNLNNVILNKRVMMADMDPPPMPPPPPPNTVETPLYQDDLTTGESGAGPVTWSVVVPKNTLHVDKSYTIIVKDTEDIASTSQGFNTND